MGGAVAIFTDQSPLCGTWRGIKKVCFFSCVRIVCLKRTKEYKYGVITELNEGLACFLTFSGKEVNNLPLYAPEPPEEGRGVILVQYRTKEIIF